MALLFEIISKRDYSIAKFFVEKDYAVTWHDNIINVIPFSLKLPDNMKHVKIEKHSEN